MKNRTRIVLPQKLDNFWLIAGLLAILLATSMTRDITRPFYGLHSWGEAHGPWNARTHIKYGLGYTKGLLTKAVGDPPIEKPLRYLNHPQLPSLLNVPFMALFGFHEWSLRIVNTASTLLVLLLFLKILRGLLDDKTALLAGLIFCLFPLIGYFGANGWLYPFGLWAIWNYLVIINGLRAGPEPKKLHRVCLAISLFMAIQMGWEGFFFDMAIGLHYVFHCLRRYIKQKELPDMRLLAILLIIPAASILTNFTVMAAGYGWDWERIFITYKWRAGSGEMPQHDWGQWFARMWEFGVTNFTLPVIIIAVLYLTIGRLFVFMEPQGTQGHRRRQFPQFWLFFMIPVFQQFVLKGCLWKHQTWERPFSFIIAMAAALGIVFIWDVLKKRSEYLAKIVIALLLGVIFLYCVIGTNYYYDIRWQPPSKIRMFKMLNEKIPPSKRLLSFEDFIVNQGDRAKIPFYRPEVAWYLDREVVPAKTLSEIEEQSKTGKYPYYLMPLANHNGKVSAYLAQLSDQLRKQYQYEYIAGEPGEVTKDGKFLKAGMFPYMIFDLTSRIDGTD
ncbi:MAG: glycosyltransferase family 39 protein [Planctomycetes bacterium]|nr:glycosyltransferase family 39 protein [Planctomycetota bacterium]